MWLAPAAGRLSDGSPAPSFDGLVSQFTPHVPALLRRLETAGVADPVRLDEMKAAVAGVVTGTDRSGERPEQLSGLMSWLLRPDRAGVAVPVVLVLDDAHELDEPTVGFVRELLASEVPMLIIATTWPERLTRVAGRPLSPFCSYLAEAAGSNRTAQRWLGELEEDDLVGYIVSQFPATDQKVAASLVWRADRNPYALRLLLNTPRVLGSIRDGAISLDPREIADLNGRLEKLLEEHWDQLPTGARHVLVAAALLGQSFVNEVLEAGLRKLHAPAGLDDALASSWIRPLGGSDRILEFAERLRYDIALGDAPNFLSAREREDILNGALRALRRLLPVEPEGTGRVVLLALHILLAREGAEDDLASAAVSAAELGERARSEYRKLEGIDYYRQAIAWTESSWTGGVVGKPAPMGQLVRYLVEHSTLNRIQYGRPDGEPSAARAVQLADQDLDPEDELRIHARCALSRARRRRQDRDAYASALDLFAEAQDLLGRLDSPSVDVVRNVRSIEIGFAEVEGRYEQGMELSRTLIAFCEEHYGPLHRFTLETLSDLAYNTHRAIGAAAAIPVRKTLLERRIRRFNDAGHLQTTGSKNGLAASLLGTRDPEHFDEAEQLLEDAITRNSRAFGYDGRATLVGRSNRTRLWMARGLLAEATGEHSTAAEWFTRAADETARLRVLREDEDDLNRYAISLQRNGEALACLRQADGIAFVDDAMDVRETRLGEDHTFWAVGECAKSLWWAYQRLGRVSEADAVARRHRFTGDPSDWVPAFVPRLPLG